MSAVRDTAALRFSEPVDGTGPAARRPSTGTRRRLATPVEEYTVDPAIMAAARAALREGERLVIVGPNDVRTVTRR